VVASRQRMPAIVTPPRLNHRRGGGVSTPLFHDKNTQHIGKSQSKWPHQMWRLKCGGGAAGAAGLGALRARVVPTALLRPREGLGRVAGGGGARARGRHAHVGADAARAADGDAGRRLTDGERCRFCACIGSPCLRNCVHGASIGGARRRPPAPMEAERTSLHFLYTVHDVDGGLPVSRLFWSRRETEDGKRPDRPPSEWGRRGAAG
jgi:hypothetical protein